MKSTTLNFWVGVLIGAGVCKFGPKWYSDAKKKLGRMSSSKKVIDNIKEDLNAINFANTGRVSGPSRSDIDKECLSAILDSQKYTSDEKTSVPDNVVISPEDTDIIENTQYIIIAGKMPDDSEFENYPDEIFEDPVDE